MEFPYKPPRHLEHLVKFTFRSQVGWGIDDDGSIGVQHIISSNPFAGKGQHWGLALIDENGDVGVMSKGPGNAKSEEDLPPELIQKLVQFYEKEGLNVRNITEVDPASNNDKTAEIDQGLALCPECHSPEVYIVPDGPMGHSDWFDCENCGYHGSRDELVDGEEDPDPDPDRSQIDEDDKLPNTENDYNDDWKDYVSKEAGAPFSTQGAVASPGSGVLVEGIAVNPKMGREAIEKLIGGLTDTDQSGRQQEFVDQMNKGQGTSFPPNDSPYLNRGGSIYAHDIEDHFLGADGPPGIPGTGVGDPRNFDAQNTPGFVIVCDYLTPDDNWLFTNKCKGVVSKVGGTNSHGAVVARQMGIAAIVAVDEADQISPGDHVRIDPTSGRVDVNGGDTSFEVGQKKRANNEVARFVWSKGNLEFSPATEPLTDELAALPYNGGHESDRSHYAMIEYMDEQGLYDWEDGTIGVVYDNGEAQYFEPITDEADLKNAIMSTFPNVHTVVYKPVQGGIYGPGAEAPATVTAEIHDEAPECPNCGSHTYDVINFPQASGDDGELQCLTCGFVYKQPLIMNPKNSAYGEQPVTAYPTDPAKQAQVIELMHQIAQASQQGNQSEVQRLQGELESLLGGNPNLPTTVQPTVEGMLKGAPYPENSDKNAPDHSPPGQKIPKKVNSIYNACMREGNGSGDTKEEKESSCMAIAWAQYKKMKKGKLIHKAEDEKVGPVEPKEAPGSALKPGTRIEIVHKDKAGQKGTIVEYHGTDGAFDDDAYDIILDSGDRIKGVREVDLKKVKRSSIDLITGNYAYDFKLAENQMAPDDIVKMLQQDLEIGKKLDEWFTNLSPQDQEEAWPGVTAAEIAINDSNGAPLQIGQLYLMHSTQYKVPDLVRIVAVDPNRIEAHIDSDVNGMFPIDLSKESFADEGYSFEPYTEKMALVDDTMNELYGQVLTVLHGGDASPEAQQIAQDLLNRYGPTDHALRAIPDADALSNFVNYKDKYMQGYSKEATRKLTVTPKRQKELIEENTGARARNFDKLNLEGTHYTIWEPIDHFDGTSIEDHFIF